MPRTIRSVIIVSCAVAVMFALPGCGGTGTPASPAAPTTTTPIAAPTATGATIAGTVVAPTGSGAVAIAIIGTSLSTTTDASGAFVLQDVPPGDIEVQFDASALQTSLMLQLTERQRLELRVTLSAGPTVLALQTGDGLQERIRLRSTVRLVEGACPDISFAVDGAAVTTNQATQFGGGACANLTTGADVEVGGTRQGNGTVLATQLQLRTRDRDQTQQQSQLHLRSRLQERSGSCPEVAFVLDGVRVRTHAGTLFAAGSCGDLANGAMVEAHGSRGGDGTMLAATVRVEQRNGRGWN